MRHWARLWRSTKSKAAHVPALMEHPSCFRGEVVSRVWSPVFLLGEVGQGEDCGGTKGANFSFLEPSPVGFQVIAFPSKILRPEGRGKSPIRISQVLTRENHERKC